MRPLTPAALAAVFFAGTALTCLAQGSETRASFDCRKAQTPREHATCASDEARKADAAMAAAYAPWLTRLSPPQLVAFKESQRRFNAYADGLCQVAGPQVAGAQVAGAQLAGSAGGEARAEASQCLATMMTERAGFLAGLQRGEVGGMRIEPRLRTEFRLHPQQDPDDKPQGWITNDVVPVLVGASAPVTAAYDKALARLIAPDKPLIAGRVSLIGAVTRSYTLSSFSHRLLSLQINEHVDAGTAVPDRDVGLNMDLTTGATVPLDAVFTRTAEWRQVMRAALKRDINRPDELDERLDTILSGGKGVIWAFGADKVTVSWTTSYPPAESAEIPLAEIARFIRQESPWQPRR